MKKPWEKVIAETVDKSLEQRIFSHSADLLNERVRTRRRKFIIFFSGLSFATLGVALSLRNVLGRKWFEAEVTDLPFSLADFELVDLAFDEEFARSNELLMNAELDVELLEEWEVLSDWNGEV